MSTPQTRLTLHELPDRFSGRSTYDHALHTVIHHHRPLCPRCSGHLRRIPRRLLDRLVSVFVPLRRYSCVNCTCQWTGLLRQRRA